MGGGGCGWGWHPVPGHLEPVEGGVTPHFAANHNGGGLEGLYDGHASPYEGGEGAYGGQASFVAAGVISAIAGSIRSRRTRSPSYLGRGFLLDFDISP